MDISNHLDFEQDSSESESRPTLSNERANALLSPPKQKKARKLCGPATYKTKFNANWKKKYPFITSVQGDPYR